MPRHGSVACFCFIAELVKQKRANLTKYYHARKAMTQVDWRFFDLDAQLVGDKEFSGEYAPVKYVHDRVHFGEDATLLLIYEYSERKELFSKAVRDHP
ncbi:HTH-type transcriptional repressor PurR [Frankliniella fusca]|uniref:HTH-type transcriptional repressor PurR n=1 Tax=Frankliniella fusca TaxID=407009 RepID=A0AAE1LGC4_9NEOP|nr:HTH-type transcriptional repressor PurR [Frankliniella fusca]